MPTGSRRASISSRSRPRCPAHPDDVDDVLPEAQRVAPTPTIVTRMCEGILVVVHSMQAPTDPEWNDAVAYIDQHLAGLTRLNVLVRAESGPNAIQRARLNAVLERVPVRTAVLSSSPIVRGITIAMRWMGLQQIQSFGPRAVHEGLDYLELSRARHGVVIAELGRMIAMVDIADPPA
jgi:hypothetical protein